MLNPTQEIPTHNTGPADRPPAAGGARTRLARVTLRYISRLASISSVVGALIAVAAGALLNYRTGIGGFSLLGVILVVWSVATLVLAFVPSFPGSGARRRPFRHPHRRLWICPSK